MIIGYSFKEDNNFTLKAVQNDLYCAILPWLFEYPKQNYLKSVKLVGIKTELADKIAEGSSFDLKTLQEAHDIIAAYYRFIYPDKIGQLVIPHTVPMCEKLTPLEALKELYRREWCKFWHGEAKALAEIGEITRAILNAIAFQNTEKGYKAETLLNKMLRDRYEVS